MAIQILLPIVKSKYLWDSNHHLSAGRALSVFQYLVNKENIDEKRIHIAGYGPNRPIATNTTKAGKERIEELNFSSCLQQLRQVMNSIAFLTK